MNYFSGNFFFLCENGVFIKLSDGKLFALCLQIVNAVIDCTRARRLLCVSLGHKYLFTHITIIPADIYTRLLPSAICCNAPPLLHARATNEKVKTNAITLIELHCSLRLRCITPMLMS